MEGEGFLEPVWFDKKKDGKWQRSYTMDWWTLDFTAPYRGIAMDKKSVVSVNLHCIFLFFLKFKFVCSTVL